MLCNLQGWTCPFQTESRIDFPIKVNNNSDNQQEFIENNFEHEKACFKPLIGEGKLFPGGPTCMCKGKVVPCFTRWSESQVMSSTI